MEKKDSGQSLISTQNYHFLCRPLVEGLVILIGLKVLMKSLRLFANFEWGARNWGGAQKKSRLVKFLVPHPSQNLVSAPD